MARVGLNYKLLSPTARTLADEVAIDWPCFNPFKSIVARGLELVHAFEEALDAANKSLERARENFNVALKYYPENIQAQLGRADALHGQGRTRAAHEFYDDYPSRSFRNLCLSSSKRSH